MLHTSVNAVDSLGRLLQSCFTRSQADGAKLHEAKESQDDGAKPHEAEVVFKY